MSAQSASDATLAAANPPSADFAPIRLPGSDRTYEHRDFLKGLGLRWDPVGHAWHGLLPATTRKDLETRFGLVPRVVRPIESFQEVVLERKEAGSPSPSISRPAVSPRRLPRDCSRTRFESRLAFPVADEDEEEDDGEPADPATETRRFSWFETTSGLPEDSREEDERGEERRLRDLRGRVKAARAAISASPGSREILDTDWVKEAAFYARFGITQAQFRQGVSATCEQGWDSVEKGTVTLSDEVAGSGERWSTKVAPSTSFNTQGVVPPTETR